jgi:hypothetical protein
MNRQNAKTNVIFNVINYLYEGDVRLFCREDHVNVWEDDT